MCVKRWPKPLVGNLGDPVGCMPPKPGEQREKAMRTSRGGGICLHQVMRTVKMMNQREGEHVLTTLG